jgi:hypothetical protein
MNCTRELEGKLKKIGCGCWIREGVEERASHCRRSGGLIPEVVEEVRSGYRVSNILFISNQ